MRPLAKGSPLRADFTIMQAQRQSKRSVLGLLWGNRGGSGLALAALALLSAPAGSLAANVSDPAVLGTSDNANLFPGFKVERYAHIWQRNPFTLVTPAAPREQDSPFSKMFLTSWLKHGSQEVIFVQNSDTNVVQKITEQPNQNNLRLLELRSNLDPKLVEAVVSDGREKGIVKFRFEAQATTAQAFSPEVLAHSRTPPGYSPVPPGSLAAPKPLATSAKAQGALNAGSQAQGQPSLPQANFRSNSGSSSPNRMQMSSSGKPVRVFGSEGVRLPAP
jgi:hypothetical protein